MFDNLSNIPLLVLEKFCKWSFSKGVRLEWILSTFPVISRDQANFGKSPIFSFILGLGGWNRVGGIKYTLFDSLNPKLGEKGCFYQNWLGRMMWLERLIIFILTLPFLKQQKFKTKGCQWHGVKAKVLNLVSWICGIVNKFQKTSLLKSSSSRFFKKVISNSISNSNFSPNLNPTST